MTERRLLNIELEGNKARPEDHIFSKNTILSMIAMSNKYQKVLYVPVYIRGLMKELVNVNLKEKSIRAAFKIEVYTFIDISLNNFQKLHSEFITDPQELISFLQNNLTL